MIASERLGASQAKVLKYANSGDTPGGDKSRVVGYGAVAFVKPQARAALREAPFSLSRGRKTSCSRSPANPWKPPCGISKQYEYSPPAGLEALEQERGAFVTLNEHGATARLHRLRGAFQAALRLPFGTWPRSLP